MIGDELKLDDQVFVKHWTLGGSQLALGKVVKKSKTLISVEAPGAFGSTFGEFDYGGSQKKAKGARYDVGKFLISVKDGKDEWERQGKVNNIWHRIYFLSNELKFKDVMAKLDIKTLTLIAGDLEKVCKHLGEETCKPT